MFVVGGNLFSVTNESSFARLSVIVVFEQIVMRDSQGNNLPVAGS